MERTTGQKDERLKFIQVLLMSEDRGIAFTIGFLGFGYDYVEKYLAKNIIESGRPWTKKYTQMKYV